jgi:AP2 domain/HNH endonuclease
MKRIPLTQGQFALVDDEDFERLNIHKWCAVFDRRRRLFYATRQSPRFNGKQRVINMHRSILGALPGEQVDHKNHDTLDNQRENLRICSVPQNSANRRMSINNTSGYKGVSWHKRDKRWFAYVNNGHGRQIYIGYYSTAREAAAAYDLAAVRYFGEFALTNQDMGLLAD